MGIVTQKQFDEEKTRKERSEQKKRDRHFWMMIMSNWVAYSSSFTAVLTAFCLLVGWAHFVSFGDFLISTILMVGVLNQWVWTHKE